jgi:hypothetical protein
MAKVIGFLKMEILEFAKYVTFKLAQDNADNTTVLNLIGTSSYCVLSKNIGNRSEIGGGAKLCPVVS